MWTNKKFPQIYLQIETCYITCLIEIRLNLLLIIFLFTVKRKKKKYFILFFYFYLLSRDNWGNLTRLGLSFVRHHPWVQRFFIRWDSIDVEIHTDIFLYIYIYIWIPSAHVNSPIDNSYYFFFFFLNRWNFDIWRLCVSAPVWQTIFIQ